MRQRLGFAEILMKEVSIAILDEPTSGLDPHATAELLDMIRSLKRDGVAVLVSSHLLERVQSICDRVALFNAGRIALLGTVPELARQVLGGGYTVEVEADGGRRSPTGSRQCRACARSISPGRAATGCWPRATCARRPRPRWSTPADSSAACRSRSRRSTPSTTAISRIRALKMRREGSPWRGLSVVFFRELFDHLTSARMLVLQFLVMVFGGVVVYFAAEQIRNTTAEDPFLFLRLFAPPGQTLLSFVLVLSILVPIMAIGLGFDSVNGEYNRRTMSRILAQPIYRDALLFGKFLAGLATITICLITLWLLVIGFGLLRLGIPPSAEEIARC